MATYRIHVREVLTGSETAFRWIGAEMDIEASEGPCGAGFFPWNKDAALGGRKLLRLEISDIDGKIRVSGAR